jgi:chemotaxis signal transduction protein
MAVFSPLTSRRSTARKAEATQQLIVFRLRNESFALPIRASLKVIPMGKIYGTLQITGVGLTLYQDQELLVIDVEQRIFKGSFTQNSLPMGGTSELLPPSSTTEGRYLLIVQSSSRKLVGLPLFDPPSLQRVPESAFAPLTSDYLSQGNIRCISALIIQPNDQPPLFLLNPDQLVQPQSALPSTCTE